MAFTGSVTAHTPPSRGTRAYRTMSQLQPPVPATAGYRSLQQVTVAPSSAANPLHPRQVIVISILRLLPPPPPPPVCDSCLRSLRFPPLLPRIHPPAFHPRTHPPPLRRAKLHRLPHSRSVHAPRYVCTTPFLSYCDAGGASGLTRCAASSPTIRSPPRSFTWMASGLSTAAPTASLCALKLRPHRSWAN